MISVRIIEKPDPNWNKRLLQTDFATFYQSKEIATYFEEQGHQPMFLQFLDNIGNIVGQILITKFSRFNVKGITGKIIKKIPMSKTLICKWSYGPVIFSTEHASEIYLKLGEFLSSKKYAISGWQHPFSPPGITVLKNKFELVKWATFIIDLTKTKEELYNNIDKHSGRKNIERSRKRGVTIEEINEKNLLDYHLIRNKMREDSQEPKQEFKVLLKWWKFAKSIGYSGFLAKKNNNPIAGILFSYLSGHIIEGGIARSEEDTKNNLYSQDLLKWSIIEWGMKNNMRYYNLAGVNPNFTSDKEKGIFRYKKKWGGKQYFYYNIQK